MFGTWGRRLVLVAGVVLVTGLPLGHASALAVPPVPTDIPVVDQTKTLADAQKQSLATKIAKERSATGNQIAILIIPSLESDALEDYANKVFRSWGVGQKERNSGVLLLVVMNDRKLRIEVGSGLEGTLPDITAGHIIDQRIKPQFQQAKYYEGIDSGLDGIILAIHNEKDPQLQAGASGSKSMLSKTTGFLENFFTPIIAGVFLIPVWLASILGRTKSWWAGGVVGAGIGTAIGAFAGFLFVGLIAIGVMTVVGLLFDKFVSDNYQKAVDERGKGGKNTPSWWAGGPWLGGGPSGGSSGGGFGGGGFGGFGGGSSGGGGASGGW
jgi:uncharacterized protein